MLYIVATPIGNLEDITARASRILREADFILAEDTRKTGMLLKALGIKKRLESFYEHNEAAKIPYLIRALKEGKDIALVSNAGTPTICDPGYKLVRECRAQALAVTSLPGPSSIMNALAMSAIPHDKFSFLGYIPRKDNARRKFFENIKEWEVALVFFESPFRVLKSLRVMEEVLGQRRIGIFREMSKKFEEVLEAPLKEAIGYFEKKKPKGEFTLIVGGFSQKPKGR